MAESGELAFQANDPTQQVPDLRKVPPSVTGLVVGESGETDADGGVPGGVRVFFTPPEWWGELRFDVWAKHADLTGFVFLGSTRASGTRFTHPFLQIGFTYTIAVCSVSVSGASIVPESAPQAVVVLSGQADPIPDDVTGFSVVTDGPFVRFAWAAVPNPLRHIQHLRIQVGAVWGVGAVVALVAPAGAVRIAVPRAQAPGNVFAIKAITGTGRESLVAALAYLTSTAVACVDVDVPVAPREVTIPAGFSSVVVTTLCPYDTPPFVTAMGTNGLTAWADPTTFVQNSVTKLWSFMLYVDDIAAPGGEGVYLHEAGTPEPDAVPDAPPALSWAPEYPDFARGARAPVRAMPAMVTVGPVLPIPGAAAAPNTSTWHPEYPDLVPRRRRQAHLVAFRSERRQTP